MKKIYLLSLGCPRNMVDSEVLLGLFAGKGFGITEKAEDADVAVVNTCGFIEDAKQESIDIILQLAELKRAGKVGKLVVTGCLSQRYPKELLSGIKEIDGLFGSSDFVKIPEFIEKLTRGERVEEVSSRPKFLYDHLYKRQILTLPHYAYIKIQEGCSNRCSYCVIPDLKGPRRSRDIASIIKETESLRKDLDIKEAVLIGQDTTSFGLDRGKKSELPRLLKELSGIMEGRWIRLLYTHPARFTDELIETIAALDNVCGYVDLPVQHINSRILEKMNRAALKEEIIGLIGRIRSGIKDVTLRTSVIVGFPGETEEEFGELMDFLEKTKFDRLGAFIYSREESTPAYVLEGQVPEDIKKRRLDDVMQLQQEISSAKNAEMIGKTIRVLIDEKEGTQTDLFTARGEMDAPEVDGSVFIKGKGLKAGEFARVKITGAMEYDLTGDAV